MCSFRELLYFYLALFCYGADEGYCGAKWTEEVAQGLHLRFGPGFGRRDLMSTLAKVYCKLEPEDSNTVKASRKR